ncbi:MAG: PKD domain-containing protein, partial [Chitinophagales bacterium]
MSSIISIEDNQFEKKLFTTKGGYGEYFVSGNQKINVTVSSEGFQPMTTYFEKIDKDLEIQFDMHSLRQKQKEEDDESKASICGYVVNRNTGLPIQNASVRLGKFGTQTDEKGYFQIISNDYTIAKIEFKQIVRKDLVIEKKGFGTKNIHNVLINSGNVLYKIDLKKNGKQNDLYIHGMLDRTPRNDTSLMQTIESTNSPLNSGVCNIPSSIRVGTSCSCTSCSSVVVKTVDDYVGSGLDDEWISSWNTESLKAGAVAYRSYGAYYASNPVSGSFDIASTTCNQVWGAATASSCVNAATATSGEVLSNGTSTARSEYAAEQNSGLCGNGYVGGSGGWPCNSDAVCSGTTYNGHSRGCCQWGTQRWAINQSKTYSWILDHYYNPGGITQCTASQVASCSTPANNACTNAIYLAVNSSCSYQQYSSCGASNSNIGSCNAANSDDDVWFYFTANSSTTKITAQGVTDYIPAFQILSSPCGGSMLQYACVSASSAGGTVISTINTTSGTSYYVRIYHNATGYGADGNFRICITGAPTCTPPVQPSINSGQSSICSGQSVQLDALSTCSNCNYQWYKDGSIISGATSYQYMAYGAGTYYVVVSNSCGSAQSQSLSITQGQNPIPPSIQGSSNVCSNQTVTFNASSSDPLNWNVSGAGGYISANNGSSIDVVFSSNGSAIITATASNSCGTSQTASFNVNVIGGNTLPPNPTANLNSICEGASFSLSAGVTASTYLWSGPNGFTSTQANPTISNASSAASGAYSVTVSNGGSCNSSASGSVSVTVNPKPTVTASASSSSACVGNVVSLFSGNASTYLWTGPAGFSSNLMQPSFTMAANGGGQYCVIGSANGCNSTPACVNVLANTSASPTVSINSSQSFPICAGTGVTFACNVAGFVGSQSYTWKVNGATVSYSSSYYYSNPVNGAEVTLEVNGSNSCGIPVTVLSNSIIVSTTNTTVTSCLITCNKSFPICSNYPLTFSATQTGFLSSGLSYNWQKNGITIGSGATLTLQNNFADGDVITLNLNGNTVCSGSQTASSNSITITTLPIAPEPTISLAVSDSVVCSGTSIVATATVSNMLSPYTIDWYYGGVLMSSHTPSVTFTINSAVYIMAKVVVPQSGCQGPGTISASKVINTVTSSVGQIALGQTQYANCEGESLVFEAYPPSNLSSIDWWLNATKLNIHSNTYSSSVIKNGDSIRVSYTITNSCGSITTFSNTVIVNLGVKPFFDLGSDTSVCTGTTVNLNYSGSANAGVSWIKNGIITSGGLNYSFVYQNPVAIIARAIDNSSGCTSYDTIQINTKTLAKPIINFTIDQSIPNAPCFTSICTGYTSLKWDFGDSTFSSLPDPCHIYTHSGTFLVTLFAYNQCGTDIDSNAMVKVLSTTPNGIDEFQDEFQVYPNPVNDFVKIIGSEKLKKYEVFD